MKKVTGGLFSYDATQNILIFYCTNHKNKNNFIQLLYSREVNLSSYKNDSIAEVCVKPFCICSGVIIDSTIQKGLDHLLKLKKDATELQIYLIQKGYIYVTEQFVAHLNTYNILTNLALATVPQSYETSFPSYNKEKRICLKYDTQFAKNRVAFYGKDLQFDKQITPINMMSGLDINLATLHTEEAQPLFVKD